MPITIALAGNPNSGKTTLFNALTGSNQYVGNWPGVTVERKEAKLKIGEREALLTDLPGVYSLAPYSIEENITHSFIAEQRPDVVINIVDATNLERNLYLTVQLMEIGRPMVIALNLYDEVVRYGGSVDCEALSTLMGSPVVPISARNKEGFDELLAAVAAQAENPRYSHPVKEYDQSTRRAIGEVMAAISGGDGSGRPWMAMHYMDGSAEDWDHVALPDSSTERISAAISDYERRGQAKYPGSNSVTLVGQARYALIRRWLGKAAVPVAGLESVRRSARIDRIVTHKVLAFPIFLLIMGAMFSLAFGPVGSFLQDMMEGLFNDVLGPLADGGLRSVGASEWLILLITDGILAGVGGVLTFLPQILIIFLFISLLEDSGYMARAAFITDRLFRRLGLSGRSFIPMLMGFGCTTTAVIAARGVENQRDRRMTIMMTPFMSCSAKLPVYGLLTAAFFARWQGLIVLSLYALGMLVMILVGLILRKTAFKEGQTQFMMEMPPYRWPVFSNVMRRLWDRAKDFLLRAGTVIFAMSVLIWVMQSFSFSFRLVEDGRDSMFGVIGSAIAPVFRPLGFGEWEQSVALLSGLVAKEAVVSTMQVLYSAADTSALVVSLSSHFTPLGAYSFLVFILLYTPCVAALAAMKRELGSTKDFLLAFGIQIGAAYLVSLVVYQVGSLVMLMF